MTTPRFPYNFWSKLRTRDEVSSRPAGSRLALDGRFEAHEGHVGPEAPAFPQEDEGDPLHQDGPCRVVSDWRPGLGRSPLGLFVPEHYEPKYAYPLLVWLVDDEAPPADLGAVMSGISTRNFFGLTFPVPRPPAADEGPAAIEAFSAALLAELREAAVGLRRRFHIHSERVFLAGFDEGASWALHLVAQRPEWFGGAVVLGGRAASLKEALQQVGDVQGKRVLLGAHAGDAGAVAREMMHAGRLLHSAGADVETQLFEPGQAASTEVLSLVNRWMMDGLCATV